MKKMKPVIECHVYIPKTKHFTGAAIDQFINKLRGRYGWVNVLDLEHDIRVTLPLNKGMKDEILKPVY